MRKLNDILVSLQLSANPFATDTPMESLFPGGMRRASMDQLQQLSRESTNIIALTGPAGSGKTTLGDFFARQAARDQIVARIRASLLTTPAQLLEEMFKAFVLDFPPHVALADLKSALMVYLAAVHSKSRTVVLVVDDAHELSDDALSLLVRLTLIENESATLHLVLLGEPTLIDMLDYTCPLKDGQNQFTNISLHPFNAEETRNYLRYRLNCVGFNHSDHSRPLPFSQRQIDRIHKQSGGVPGSINGLAQEMLLGGSTRDVSWRQLLRVPDVLPRQYAVAAIALLAVLLIAFLAGDDETELAQNDQRTINLTVPVTGGGLSSDELGLTARDQVSSAAVQASTTGIAGSPDIAERPVADAAIPAPEALVPARQVADAVTDVREFLNAPVDASTTDADAAPPQAAQVPAAVRTVAPASTTPASLTAPASTAVTAPASPGALPGTLSDQHSRILALSSTQFTLQLLGSSSRSNVEDFVRRHASAPLYWFETRNQSAPWYVVIHGAYSTRDAAQSASVGLPEELRNLQPWIRGIDAVQSEIRAVN